MQNLERGALGSFAQDHQDCDLLYASLEESLSDEDAAAVAVSWDAFRAALHAHLDAEEKVVFPALEEATGVRSGPTEVMRREHDEMRALLARMGRAIQEGAFEAAADLGDTLLMLTQQHNIKEETVLYPAADRALAGPAWEALIPRIRAVLSADRRTHAEPK